MARIFITGSADGLGRETARTLLTGGHDVVVHARSEQRLANVRDLLERGAEAVMGDLADPDQTREIAEQVNRLGRMDAVIHNAGVYSGATILPVNVVAPYLLTALIDRPRRLVYLSSGMHRGGRADLAGLDWSGGPGGAAPPPRAAPLPRQQALRHAAGASGRPPLGGRSEQRGRPRLGPYEDGRPGRARRSAPRAPDPGVARHERRPGGADLGRLLVPPASSGAGSQCPGRGL